MQDNPSIARILSDSAEWLMALPKPTHAHLAAAGTLLIEAAHVMQGEMALAEAVMAAPNARQGNWRPRPGGQASNVRLAGQGYAGCDHPEHQLLISGCPLPADVSRETSAAPYCVSSLGWHCMPGVHCRCGSCHDAGDRSLFPDLSGASDASDEPRRLQPTPEMAEYLRQWPAGPDRPADAPTYAEWAQAREADRVSEIHH